MSSKTPCTIIYKKPGTSPPVFLAGSFTDPQWQLQEMEYTTDQNGNHTFQSEVMLEPDWDYQFKLRIGNDNWVLAENYPTVCSKATDDSGNQNNVVRTPKKPAVEQIAPAGIDTPAIKFNPANQPASTSTEAGNAGENVKDSKVPLFAHESLGNDVNEDTADNKIPLFADETLGDDGKEEEAEAFKAPLFAHETPSNDAKEDSEEMKMPLFAHECLGAYDFGQETEHDPSPIAGSSTGRGSKTRSKHDDTSDIDVNDPTLESFPSDRGSILDAIRTIQTHLGEDQTHLEDIPLSPRVISSRRTSLESSEDFSLSPASLSPTITRRRESRPSHSFGRTRSLVSLGSIEEEPKPAPSKHSPGPPVVSLPNPNTKDKPMRQKSPPSEEDEAVVMKNSEVKPSANTNGESSSQVESYEAQNTQHDKAPSATTTVEKPVAATLQEINSPGNDAPSIVQSSNEPQPTPDSVSGKKIEETAASGVSSRNPPRGNVVPLIVTTGALALAIGIGWWQAADH
ncbi:hypothetical protein FBEOM_11030 [Fusarium beomiforme]|uniref:AMP-activated protein kinase glycogen-binding domain-containing protein n=1 Tax=Fusarium beomiforme TaxID=44412 RepID=A0A9P5AAC5_9HYPO|nr:hypothetical protein FBEOM_11030 [Fusarium beomiforme]